MLVRTILTGRDSNFSRFGFSSSTFEFTSGGMIPKFCNASTTSQQTTDQP